MMKDNHRILSSLIIELCKTLELLATTEIVHSDLKTENILIRYDEVNSTLT